MEVVEFKDSHYEDVKSLWSTYNWPAPPLAFLPRQGWVTLDNGKIIASGFMYDNGKGMAQIGWIISDANVGIKRAPAVLKIIETAKEFAKNNKIQVIHTMVNNDSLKSLFLKTGFEVAETGVTTMAISLDNTSLDFIKGE